MSPLFVAGFPLNSTAVFPQYALQSVCDMCPSTEEERPGRKLDGQLEASTLNTGIVPLVEMVNMMYPLYTVATTQVARVKISHDGRFADPDLR